MWNTQIPWLEIRNFKTKVKCPLELGFHGITWPRAQRNGEIPGEAGHPPRCQRPLTDDYWWKKIDFVTGKSSFSLWCWFVWQPFACSSFIFFAFLPLAMIHRLVGDCWAPQTMALLQRPLIRQLRYTFFLARPPHFAHESATDTTALRLPFIKAKLTNLPIASAV